MPNGRGSVTVRNRNLGQGSFPEIERKLLFLGHVPEVDGSVPSLHEVISVNSQTDFDGWFGEENDSTLKKNMVTAQLNGGQNWEAWMIPMDSGSDYLDVIDDAMESCSPEGIVILEPVAIEEEIRDYRDKSLSINARWGRQVFMLLATIGIDSATQSWSEYESYQIDMQANVAGNTVVLVPMLHGNDVAALAGRLCNRISSIADTPMRTLEPGPVLGLGDSPVDKDGKSLKSATLANLAANRLSCIQAYPDYPGIYWGDATTLEVPAGDFEVIEYVRPAMKAARAVRILAINMIGDRKFNSTPASMESMKTYFARPLREMSKTTKFAGTTFPGEIKKPSADAIAITWHTKKKVEVFVKVCPYNSPKDLIMNIVLDLKEAA